MYISLIFSPIKNKYMFITVEKLVLSSIYMVLVTRTSLWFITQRNMDKSRQVLSKIFDLYHAPIVIL